MIKDHNLRQSHNWRHLEDNLGWLIRRNRSSRNDCHWWVAGYEEKLKIYKNGLPTDASQESSPPSTAKSTDDSSPKCTSPSSKKKSYCAKTEARCQGPPLVWGNTRNCCRRRPLSVLPVELQPPIPPSLTPSTP